MLSYVLGWPAFSAHHTHKQQWLSYFNVAHNKQPAQGDDAGLLSPSQLIASTNAITTMISWFPQCASPHLVFAPRFYLTAVTVNPVCCPDCEGSLRGRPEYGNLDINEDQYMQILDNVQDVPGKVCWCAAYCWMPPDIQHPGYSPPFLSDAVVSSLKFGFVFLNPLFSFQDNVQKPTKWLSSF